MATQVSRAERLAAADDIVVNDTGLAEIESQVNALHQRYLALEGDKVGLKWLRFWRRCRRIRIILS